MFAEVLLGLGARTREWICALHGHDNLMQFGPDRLSVRCVTCGHETPGWRMDPPHYRVRSERTGWSRERPPVVRWPKAA